MSRELHIQVTGGMATVEVQQLTGSLEHVMLEDGDVFVIHDFNETTHFDVQPRPEMERPDLYNQTEIIRVAPGVHLTVRDGAADVEEGDPPRDGDVE